MHFFFSFALLKYRNNSFIHSKYICNVVNDYRLRTYNKKIKNYTSNDAERFVALFVISINCKASAILVKQKIHISGILWRY